MKTVKMNSWPQGVNNIAPDNALPTDQYGRTNTLRDAVNVDVLTSGKLRRRAGITPFISDPNAHSVYGFNNYIIWATPTTLKIYSSAKGVITLLTNPKLADTISYTVVNNRLYWSNENINGIINADGTYEPWGIVAPTTGPTATAAAGTNRYQVTCTFVTASGEESGAPIGVEVVCSDLPNIFLTNIPQSSDPRVVATRIYITDVDGTEFYREIDVPAGISYTALNGYFARGKRLMTQFMDAPPPGQIIEYNNGVIYIASGNIVYHTKSLNYGVVDYATSYYMYPERVTMCASVPDGLYISSDQVYYLPQNGTDDVAQVQTIPCRAIEGAKATVPDSQDILFLSDRGFYRASLQGQVKNLTEDNLAIDYYAGGAMGYVERNGHRSLVALVAGGTQNPAVSDDFRAGDLQRKSDWIFA